MSTYTRICDSPEWLLALVARGGDGFVEIRFGCRDFSNQHFMPAEKVVENPEAVVTWTLNLTERFDVAVGMAVRNSKRGHADACVRVNLLWADIDGGDVEPLLALPSPPALIVESGTPRHLHAYWPLKEPVDLTDECEHARFVDNLRRVQHAVGSDAVADVSRIMRMPGTLNWKHCRSDDGDPSMATPVVFTP